MEFLVNMFNHSLLGQRTLEDIVGIMGKQLRALGHQAVWDPANDKFLPGARGYNLIVEGFTVDSIRAIAKSHAEGARFIYIATEEPTDKGFNHGRDPEMAKRQQTFVEAAQFADGILHLVPGEAVTRWYGQFAPAAYVELGYAPSLIRAPDGIEPEYDFGFFGTLSKRRLAMLKRLARRTGTAKAVRLMADFKTQVERDQVMRQAKVIVQIRKHEEMGLVSSSRCNTALCLGRAVIAEPHEHSHPWDEVVHFSKSTEAFFDEAIAVRAAWRGVHAGQLARFKEKFSPERSIGRPLQEIGILAGAARSEVSMREVVHA